MKIKKMDLIIILFFLILAGIFYAVSRYGGEEESLGREIVIYSDNKLYERIKIDEETEKTVEVKSKYGKNTLIIENGGVRIEASDCSDKVCVKEGLASKQGQTLVCLPHKLVVEVVGIKSQENSPENSPVDVVTY